MRTGTAAAALKHARLHQELTEILDITQQAFADVRAVSQTYRAMSLNTEVDTVFRTLRAMGIQTVFRGGAGPLPPEIETALATVLREGATNMLRHSRVGTCILHLGLEQGTVRMTLTNDGLMSRAAPGPPSPGPEAGSPTSANASRRWKAASARRSRRRSGSP